MPSTLFERLIPQGIANFMANPKSALLGAGGEPVVVSSSNTLPQNINDYVSSLPKQDYAQALYNQPKELGLQPSQINQGVAQGLNFGIPQIAEAQNALGINIPKTEQERELARVGQFNNYYTSNLETTPRQGGLLRDIASGYNENFNTPFSVDNIGYNKNTATKIGEILGTGARFANSPAGRSLITAGIVGMTGGSPLQAITYGAKTGVENQRLKTQDTIYRKALEDAGIDTSNITGYIDDNIYRNYSLGNYRSGMLNIGNRRLTEQDFQKVREFYGKQLQNGVITPEDYDYKMGIAQEKYNNDVISAALDYGDTQKSNQTRNADTYQKGIEGNLGLKQDMQGLTKEKVQLQIKQLQAINKILESGETVPQIDNDPLNVFK